MAKRGRPKKKKEDVVKTEEKVEVEDKEEAIEPQKDESELQKTEKKEPILEKKEDKIPKEKLFTFYEASKLLGINEACVKLWVEHGHLDFIKIGGVRKITNTSILTCPFRRYK